MGGQAVWRDRTARIHEHVPGKAWRIIPQRGTGWGLARKDLPAAARQHKPETIKLK